MTNKVYVANAFTGAGNVTVIDGATDETSPIFVGGAPQSIAVNPVTNKIWVSAAPGTVTVINGVDNSEVTHLTVGTALQMLVVNPMTNKAYVVNFDDAPNNTAFEIDGATYTPTPVPLGGTFPYTLAVNPVTNKVYVACFDQTGFPSSLSSVTVIDGATRATTVLSAVGNGANLNIVAVNPVTNRVYVSIPGTMTVLDGAINATSTVSAGTGPRKAAVNPVTNKIYVTNYGSGGSGSTVSVIDGATGLTSTVSVDSGPFDLAVNPVTNKVYVGNYGSGTGTTPNTLSVIDGSTNSVTDTVTVGVTPTAVELNPVTNKIYVANFGTGTSGTNGSVSVIDGASGTVTKTLPWVGQPDTVAVNPATNKVYVATFRLPGAYGNTVSVIDGATDTVTSTVTVGLGPYEVAVNPVTNRIYVVNYQDGVGNTVSVIDGATDTLADTVTVGTGPFAVAVNSATNKIYVANLNSNTVSVIDGATDTVTTVAVGTGPRAVTVNPVTNSVYVPNNADNTVSVIDGASSSVTSTVSAGTNPYVMAMNPVTNRAYVTNANSDNVTVIDVDGHVTVPLDTTPAGVTDALTVSTTNVFQTANRTPSFTVSVHSTFSTTNVYSGHTGIITDPPPTQVYYQVDGANPSNLGTKTTSAGTNPTSFTVDLSKLSQPQQLGLHTLYVYAAYGNEGSHSNTGVSNGDSPEIGNLTAYLFLIVPVSTTTTLSSSVNPQVQGQPVVFTAQVEPPAPTGAPALTGTVTFEEGTTVLGTGTVNGSGQATFTTSSLSVGDHLITAVYSGDPNYAPSTSSPLTQTIITPPPETIELAGGNDQSAVYGTAFAQPLAVVVTLSNGTPAAGVNVAFVGAGLSFSSNGVAVTNSSGQASVTATGTHVGAFQASAMTAGVSQNVTFALTVTLAKLTVTANNALRVFDAVNPAFTATITGFVNGDTSAVVSGTPNFTTTATQSSPVGTYPITPTHGTLAAANYTFAFAPGTLTVTQAPAPPIVENPPPPEIVEDQPVTLTVELPAGATGTVTFYLDSTTRSLGTPLGTAPVVNGTATLTIPSLPLGTHTVSAAYSGDANFAPSTSTLFTVTVTPPPDFAVSSSTPPQLIPPGASASFAIHIPSVNAAFTNVVALTASGLPAGASYTFNPATVTPGSAGADSTLTISVPHQSAMLRRNLRMPLVLAVLLVPFALGRRTRGRPPRLLLWMLAALAGFTAMTGCGTGGYFNQPQQTYTVTVTGTSGSLIRSTTVTLTVQ
ncbi:MAG TPA: Ig-like domain repeat protein [Edaphobacter sp.]